MVIRKENEILVLTILHLCYLFATRTSSFASVLQRNCLTEQLFLEQPPIGCFLRNSVSKKDQNRVTYTFTNCQNSGRKFLSNRAGMKHFSYQRIKNLPF